MLYNYSMWNNDKYTLVNYKLNNQEGLNMEEKNMGELLAEATGLGIDTKGIKSKVNMQKAIDKFYDAEAAKSAPVIKEEVEESTKEVVTDVRDSKENKIRKLMGAAKIAAMKTRIVTITNNDKRDNHMTTTAYLGFENQYFGVSKVVPLDVPIELEQCLIDVAKDCMIVNHVAEVKNGVRTGNTTPKSTRKYAVSFEDIKKVTE